MSLLPNLESPVEKRGLSRMRRVKSVKKMDLEVDLLRERVEFKDQQGTMAELDG